MNYIAYKLKFLNGVHLGTNSLVDSNFTFGADTLFSALCHEATKMGTEKLNLLVDKVRTNKLRISDALPYIGSTLYVPKPIRKSVRKGTIDSVERKAMNKLSYVPVDKMEDYFAANLDVVVEQEKLSKLGGSHVRAMVGIGNNYKSEPYHVGIYDFQDNNGLYILLAYEEDEDKCLFEELITALSYVGIGGKRSVGLGRFYIEKQDIDATFRSRLVGNACGAKYMTLSVELPTDEELDKTMLTAEFSLVKKSGFIANGNRESQEEKKKDLYVFAAGACFSTKFDGDIYQVGSDSFPVYRYAKPLFMEVSE